jgi:hypothetical protein
MAIRTLNLGPIPNALAWDDTVTSDPGTAGRVLNLNVPQSAPSAAVTNHTIASWADAKNALDALGTRLNELRTALINAGVLTT